MRWCTRLWLLAALLGTAGCNQASAPRAADAGGAGQTSSAALAGAAPTASAVVHIGRLDDDRVMLQGFYWESCRHGQAAYPRFGNRRWYAIVHDEAAAIAAAHIDLVWLPPPCYAGEDSAGYNPKQYFRLDSSYGSFAEQRAALVALLTHGVEPIADIVINHRDGTSHWADFQNPTWGTWSICRDDEAFTNPASEVVGTPEAQRGAPEEDTSAYTGVPGSRAYAYGDFRDLDHTDARVRRDIVRWLLSLKSLGYRGWRYDMAHGYHARWIARYNALTRPSFTVGEYDWSKQDESRGWMWYTATAPTASGLDRLSTCSCVFDFATFFALKSHQGDYRAWSTSGPRLGLVGDTTDGLPWRSRAVTFVENHDTGYRTNPDGTPQAGHQSDSFANGWPVEQAYAFILTHPGIPCVAWKHFFDWGPGLHDAIAALISARKLAGVNASSNAYAQLNARDHGVYAALVTGRGGGDQATSLCVRIGGDDTQWTPTMSGYTGYRVFANGNGWTVWLSSTAAGTAPAPHAPFPVPEFKPAEAIAVPNDP